MTKFIANAFSLQMLKGDASLRVTEVKENEVDLTSCVSAVGHADTAAVLGVEFNRTNLTLERGDELFVAQLMGGRLPEGSTTLPEGFKFKFMKVEVL